MSADAPSTPPAPPDAADAAGGEAVYSSDGLPPLPAPAPPVAPRPGPTEGDGGEDAIDEGNVDPASAFEVFRGRVYLNEGGAGAGRVRAGAGTRGVGGAEEAEAPLRRLARLSAEVKELESELLAAAPATSGDAAGGGGADAEELTRLARDLASRLEALSGSPAAARGRGESLTDLVRAELERIKEEGEKAQAAGGEAGDKPGGVVYELYASLSSDSGAQERTAPSEASLEERLLRIERSVGSASAPTLGNKTVLERLEEAEKAARVTDEKKLEKAAARAKVIRADLEAAAKARSKLSSASVSSVTPEDAATISSLHDQLLDLEGISAHLPAVVTRLQELSGLHGQAADFAGRLTAVEGVAAEAERLLIGAEEALAAVEGGWRANLEAVERNMKALDERMGGSA